MSALDRDSSVTLRAMLTLSPKRFRLFMIASIEGTWIPQGGGNGRPLRRGDRATAIEVGPARRTKILERAGCTRKTWDNSVREWTEARLAHRCTRGSRGVVTLFIAPLAGEAAVCPRCDVPLRGQVGPVEGTTLSRSGDFGRGDLNRANRDNAVDAVKVQQQGEGEGGEAPPRKRTALQKVLEEEQALERIRAAFPEAKEEAS